MHSEIMHSSKGTYVMKSCRYMMSKLQKNKNQKMEKSFDEYNSYQKQFCLS